VRASREDPEVFEQPPEKAPHFAFHRVGFVGIVGGLIAVFIVMWLFGAERVGNSDVVLIGTFLVGAAVGTLLGWRWVMPAQPHPDE
jgi:hypothetical protein